MRYEGNMTICSPEAGNIPSHKGNNCFIIPNSYFDKFWNKHHLFVFQRVILLAGVQSNTTQLQMIMLLVRVVLPSDVT